MRTLKNTGFHGVDLNREYLPTNGTERIIVKFLLELLKFLDELLKIHIALSASEAGKTVVKIILVVDRELQA